ncbi:hypothetical protein BDV25DRAFT_172289 [Aspergillus avenaceus]|uniref:Uncharacterized protein n=1 Tax=Aspergillus avenaceus TaxID=36643 RepID=A0A5N6TVE2_ASPAV|nr:hypothetical protein BDV25DRAFT_172289 [Aspergillus avenaceus]
MEEQKPLRVLVTISHKSTYWEQSWSASEDLLPVAFEVLKSNQLLRGSYSHQPTIKLLAKQRWATQLFLVFDIANTSYDPETGHLLEQNQLPVAIVRLGKTVQAYSAGPPVQNKINKDIARIHNHNGINSLPPFAVDYTIGPPLYTNPRDPSSLFT